MHIQDGYKLVRANQLVAALAALNSERIRFRSFRVYLACHEMLAIREAAERTNGKPKKATCRRFRKEEIFGLIGSQGMATISRDLHSLRRAGLLSFSETDIVIGEGSPDGSGMQSLLGGRGEKRLVPVPRKMLAFLARCSRPALAKTVIAYLLRGLSLDRTGEMRGAGTVKISWICKLCNISERAARSARAELIRLGWISKDTGSFQRKLNRDGAYFLVNKTWGRAGRESAPPQPKRSAKLAPPHERLETPSDSKNQKLAERDESGFRGKGRGEKPCLKNIRSEDIRKPRRLLKLFDEATKAGWLDGSEANLLNFAGAAVRANRAAGDSVRIFVGIVRKRLWHHISHDDEERARAVIGRRMDRSESSMTSMFQGSRTVPHRSVPLQMTEISVMNSQKLPQRMSESLDAIFSRFVDARA